MRLAGKISNILGIIVSLAGLITVVVLLIINKVDNYEYLSQEIRKDLWVDALWLLILSVLCIVLHFDENKGICIGGLVICFLGSRQTYGVVSAAAISFIINLIYILNKEKKEAEEKQKMIESLPEEERPIQFEQGLIQNNNIDYSPYVKKYMILYIISMLLSISYIVLIVIGIGLFIRNMFNHENDVVGIMAAIGLAFLGLLMIPLILLVIVALVYGLIAPIVAITVPTKAILIANIVVGFVTLTLFNAIASIIILNQAADDSSKINTY